jgi:hypothetical protein
VTTREESIAKVGADTLQLIRAQPLNQLDLHVASGFGSIWVLGQATIGLQSGTIWRLDPRTAILTAGTPVNGTTPQNHYLDSVAIAVGAGGVWIALADQRAVIRLDPRTGYPVARIGLGRKPIGIATGLGRVWVTVS